MDIEKEVDLLTQSWEDGEHYKKLCQPTLRDYVTNKEFSLDKRFNVWSKWCDKIEHPWIIHEADIPVIGKMVEECEPYDYDRYRNYDWQFFLQCIEDNVDIEEEYKIKWLPSVEDFKELLIEHNFGSFYMDW